VNIGQTSGYGEYFQGLLNGTYAYREFDGSEDWKISSTGNNYFYEIGKNSMIEDTIIANEFDNNHRTPTVAYIGIYNTVRFIQLRPSTAELDLEAWKIWLNDNHLFVIYKLANQTTPTITPQEFATLCQAFGITGNTYPITFGQTVYGGEYDARTGVLTVTHGMVDLGDLTWTKESNHFYSNILIDAKYPPNNSNVAEMLCEQYQVIAEVNVASEAVDNSIGMSRTGRIYIYDSSLSSGDATAFTTVVAGVKLVYELATPQTIQLPPCPIDTLEGVNNIWADTGDTTLQYIKLG
jgi:hypothetical protein